MIKQIIRQNLIICVILILYAVFTDCGNKLSSSDTSGEEIRFPVQPDIFVSGAFSRCEGIAFNGEGNLYVAGDQALWQVDTDGDVTKICDAYSNLGLAPFGNRDLLFADFGPTNAWSHGPNSDGIVWRVTPDGERNIAAGDMGDPNFILVLPDGSFLVSDDATDEIFIVQEDGSVSIFTQSVDHPNGLALSNDTTRLYIAQMFQSINPNITDGRIWALPLANGYPYGEPEVIADLGDGAACDGLAMDFQDRIYVAAWGAGQIWRLDPRIDERVLIAGNMMGVASLAFGRGAFDQEAIYATSTALGVVWRVSVGVEGADLHR